MALAILISDHVERLAAGQRSIRYPENSRNRELVVPRSPGRIQVLMVDKPRYFRFSGVKAEIGDAVDIVGDVGRWTRRS